MFITKYNYKSRKKYNMLYKFLFSIPNNVKFRLDILAGYFPFKR